MWGPGPWGAPTWGGWWVFPLLGLLLVVLMATLCARMMCRMRGRMTGGGGPCRQRAGAGETDDLGREVRELRREIREIRAGR